VARQRTITLAQINSTAGYKKYLPAATPYTRSTAPPMLSTAPRVKAIVTKYRTDLESEFHEDCGRVGLNRNCIRQNFTQKGHPNPHSTKTRSGPRQLSPREKGRQNKKLASQIAPSVVAPVIYEPEKSALTKTVIEKNPNSQPIELKRLYP
jgi:hypothetical protein